MRFIHKGQHCLFAMLNVADDYLKGMFMLIYSNHGSSNSSNDDQVMEKSIITSR